MTNDMSTSVDVRVLADLRRMAQNAQQAESENTAENTALRAKLAQAQQEIQKAEEIRQEVRSTHQNEIDLVKADLARALNTIANLRESNGDLSVALQAAQRKYLEIHSRYETLEQRFELEANQNQTIVAERDQLRADLRRIKGSRAWRIVSRYRQAVRRLRR